MRARGCGQRFSSSWHCSRHPCRQPGKTAADADIGRSSYAALDSEARRRRKSMGEDFPPQDQLALAEALSEIDQALALDEYDAELWNLKAAWCVLARRYEESIACADQAIELRPEGYPEPYQNKTISLWWLGRRTEARACAETGIRQAEAGHREEQIDRIKGMIHDLAATEGVPTLPDMQPLMEGVVRAAVVSADHFLEPVSDRRRRCRGLLPAPPADTSRAWRDHWICASNGGGSE